MMGYIEHLAFFFFDRLYAIDLAFSVAVVFLLFLLYLVKEELFVYKIC